MPVKIASHLDPAPGTPVEEHCSMILALTKETACTHFSAVIQDQPVTGPSLMEWRFLCGPHWKSFFSKNLWNLHLNLTLF